MAPLPLSLTQPRLTRDLVREECRRLGFSFRRTSGGDYRVAQLPHEEPDAERREARAHYTDDLQDALDTARAMRRQLNGWAQL